jgi:hypothetical protein
VTRNAPRTSLRKVGLEAPGGIVAPGLIRNRWALLDVCKMAVLWAVHLRGGPRGCVPPTSRRRAADDGVTPT